MTTESVKPSPLNIFVPYRAAPLLDKLLKDATTHINSLIEKNLKPTNVFIKVDNLQDGRMYFQIPGVKKLFQKAITAGLLGLLMKYGYVNTAKQTYAIAYLKPKEMTYQKLEDGSTFLNFRIKTSDFDEKVNISTEKYNLLVPDLTIATALLNNGELQNQIEKEKSISSDDTSQDGKIRCIDTGKTYGECVVENGNVIIVPV